MVDERECTSANAIHVCVCVCVHKCAICSTHIFLLNGENVIQLRTFCGNKSAERDLQFEKLFHHFETLDETFTRSEEKRFYENIFYSHYLHFALLESRNNFEIQCKASISSVFAPNYNK